MEGLPRTFTIPGLGTIISPSLEAVSIGPTIDNNMSRLFGMILLIVRWHVSGHFSSLSRPEERRWEDLAILAMWY